MDTFKPIRAYHNSAFLRVTDPLTILPFLWYVRYRTADSLTLEEKAHPSDFSGGALFLSNHRDIIMDASWLSYLLRRKYGIRPYMGIGDNLYGKWWIEPFLKFNHGFTVLRGGNIKELLAHSQLLSGYIQHLRLHGESVWLAQREGRAKDGNDLTQSSIIKMLTLYEDPHASRSLLEKIQLLNICPVCINYEFDPCDYLKAAEMQLKRDNPNWKKTKQDDLTSMHTGIWGKKGQVIYRITPSINHWIEDQLPRLQTLSRNQLIEAVASRIDYQIHSNYQIYPRGKAFEEYIESRLRLITIPNKDESFLRDKLYLMYQNPVTNYEKSHLPG